MLLGCEATGLSAGGVEIDGPGEPDTEDGVGAETDGATVGEGGAGGDEIADGPGLPELGDGDEVGVMAGGVAVVEGVGEVAVLDGEGEPVNGGVWVVAGGLAEAVGAEDGAC